MSSSVRLVLVLSKGEQMAMFGGGTPATVKAHTRKGKSGPTMVVQHTRAVKQAAKPSTEFTVTFKGGKQRPVWETTPGGYQAANDATMPGIGEISGVQRGRMSGAANRRYNADRHARSEAAGAAHADWRAKVEKSYGQGLWTLKDDVPREVKSVIFQKRAEAKKEEETAARNAAYSKNVKGVDDAKVGDRLWDAIYSKYGTVKKNNRKSMRLVDEDGDEWKVSKGSRRLQWKSRKEMGG